MLVTTVLRLSLKKKEEQTGCVSPTAAHLSALPTLTLHDEGGARAHMLHPSALFPPRHRGAVIDPAVVAVERVDLQRRSVQLVFVRIFPQLQENVVVFLE